MTGIIDWLDAIVHVDTKDFYLWGGPGYKPPHMGNIGIPERKFEFEKLDGPPETGVPFFFALDGRPGQFKMAVAKDSNSMYASGGHLYPMTAKQKWRIVRWLPIAKTK